MRATSIQAAEPSFFYLVMAKSCFRRAVSTPHPKAGGTLRELGRNYLAKAGGIVPGQPRARRGQALTVGLRQQSAKYRRRKPAFTIV